MKQSRQTSTKQNIKIALTELLAQQSFEEITVSALVKKAEINRGTFYRHYLDKYDLMDQLKAETEESLLELIADEEQSFPEILTGIFHYILEDYPFISVVSTSHFVNFSGTVRAFIKTALEQKQDLYQKVLELSPLPKDYALMVYLASIESVISLWISRGCQESPSQMTQMILHIPYQEIWKQESSSR